ncbi:MAG: hypothetical protein WDM76_04340 [Limisphaerales bacterium]
MAAVRIKAIFSYQMRSGNFDVSVRVENLGLSDIFAKAGLMARETLDPGSRFAATTATPAMTVLSLNGAMRRIARAVRREIFRQIIRTPGCGSSGPQHV